MGGAVMASACVECGSEATRTVDGRVLCDSPSCDKGQGTRNEDKDKVGTEGGGGLPLVPSSLSTGKREPEIHGLVRDWEQGLLKPVVVELGELPGVGTVARDFKGDPVIVTDGMERVAADIRLLLGLRLAVSEDRPLPYSTRFCAQRCRLRGHQEASRVLRALERLGVVECVGKMKPRGQPYGTKLYAAPRGGAS
jgi:hypothetical protein